MNNARMDSLELERQFAEAIDNLFDVARKSDFSSAERVTYLATTSIDKKFFGLRWTERTEKLTNSLVYQLHGSESDFENGLCIAVEGTFIEIPPSHSMEWPFSIKRPRASEDLVREINIAANRIAS